MKGERCPISNQKFKGLGGEMILLYMTIENLRLWFEKWKIVK